VLLSVRRPVSFEGTSGSPSRDTKANQRRKHGPDTDVRRGFASRGPAHAAHNDRAADVARGSNVGEDAIEIIPQVDEGLHGHALMPSRSQAFDHFWKPDALRVTLRHGPPFYGGLAARTFYVVPLRRSDLSYDGFRLDSEPIVHGHRSFCLHLRVPLCRLDGDAAEQKLDLIEPDAGGCRPMSTAALTQPKGRAPWARYSEQCGVFAVTSS
jgi:hypothetical protein